MLVGEVATNLTAAGFKEKNHPLLMPLPSFQTVSLNISINDSLIYPNSEVVPMILTGRDDMWNVKKNQKYPSGIN